MGGSHPITGLFFVVELDEKPEGHAIDPETGPIWPSGQRDSAYPRTRHKRAPHAQNASRGTRLRPPAAAPLTPKTGPDTRTRKLALGAFRHQSDRCRPTGFPDLNGGWEALSISGTPRVSVGRLRFCAVRAGVPVGGGGVVWSRLKGGGRRRRGASAGAGPGLPVLPSCTRPGGSRSRDGSDDASREAFAKDRRGALDREGAGCRQRRGGDDPRHWRRTATGTA